MDEYSACIMVDFVVVVLLSYLALRLKTRPRLSKALETTADAMFILGLACLTGVGLLFGYQVI